MTRIELKKLFAAFVFSIAPLSSGGYSRQFFSGKLIIPL